jgi:hypothetical protein
MAQVPCFSSQYNELNMQGQSLEALAFLKAKLLAEGIRLAPSISAEDIKRPFYSIVTQGVELNLSNGITANAWVNPASDIVLRLIEQHMELSIDGARYPTLILPPPSILSAIIPGTSLPVADFCHIATDRINIWAVESCAMMVHNTPCQFCDVAFDKTSYHLQNIDNIGKAITLLVNNKNLPARHIQVSGGTPLNRDWGHFLKACEVATETGLPVSVMLTPQTPLDVLRKLCEMGVAELALNIEFNSDEFRRKVTPGKKGYNWNRLAKAAELWPEKKVRSALIVGLEPEKETIAGVNKMLERGIVPMLSPFRPAPGTPLAEKKAPTAEFLYSVFMRSFDAALKHGSFVGPTCTPCQHNAMALPLHLCNYVP